MANNNSTESGDRLSTPSVLGLVGAVVLGSAAHPVGVGVAGRHRPLADPRHIGICRPSAGEQLLHPVRRIRHGVALETQRRGEPDTGAGAHPGAQGALGALERRGGAFEPVMGQALTGAALRAVLGRHELDDMLADTVAGDTPNPMDTTQASEQAWALHECLRKLDGRQREVVSLAYLRDLSHGELATQLRLPLGTVKTWIRRGLEQLRGCMARFA